MSNDLPWTISPQSVPPPIRKKRKKKSLTRKRVQRGPNPLDMHRPETITLQFNHNLNGTPYGPGQVTVPHVVAQELQNREYHVRKVEDRLRRDDVGVIIGGRTAQGSIRTYDVPGATFDTAYGSAIPEERISGKGYSDPGVRTGNAQF